MLISLNHYRVTRCNFNEEYEKILPSQGQLIGTIFSSFTSLNQLITYLDVNIFIKY